MFRPKRKISDFSEEIQAHIQLEIERLRGEGLSEEAAQAAAYRAFGSPRRAREAFYESHRWIWLDHLRQDVRFALRTLRKSPAFTAIAILTLALGIGANTAIFSVVDAVLLRSLPYPDANRLVIINESLVRQGELNVSLPDFLDWQAQSRAFDRMAAFSADSMTLTDAGDAVVLPTAHVSWSFFPLLGVKPFLGRTFTEAEDKPGAPWTGVVVSYSLWRSRLKGDPNIIGKPIMLEGYAFDVVGVLPPDFRFPEFHADVYMQMGPLAAFAGYADRSNHPGIRVLARLKPGESLAAARSDMDTIMARLGAEYPKSNQGERAVIKPLYADVLGGVQPLLLMLFGAAGLVLLLACVNVADLFLSRAGPRHREMALRAAIGASRTRLVRQLLTESVLLSLLGGVAGSLLATWTIKPLLHIAPRSIPNIEGVQLNVSVLAFTFLVAALTGVLFGLAPSLQTTRLDLTQSLKHGPDPSCGVSRQWLRSALLVTQIAAAVTLVVGSGLLIRSLASTLAVDPGFNPDHVLALDVILPNTNGEGALNFYNAALTRIRSLPGVAFAAAVMQPPVAGLHWTSPYMVEDRPAPPPSERPWTAINMITTDYFRTMQTRLLEGRYFTSADNAKAPLVIIINRTFAKRLWPTQSAIGKRIYAQQEWRQVVGVVADLKQFSLANPALPETFLPFVQMPVNFVTVVVRTAVDPSSLSGAVSAAIQGSDKDLPVSHVVPMTEYIAASVVSQRFSAWLLGLFGALALLLAAIGTYGDMAYSVTRRVHEVGIRMALGAKRSDVLRLVLGGGLRLAIAGIAIGLLASLGLTRLISSQLYGVTPADPLTFAAVAVLLLVVTAMASYIPARRAMRVDPMVALRYE